MISYYGDLLMTSYPYGGQRIKRFRPHYRSSTPDTTRISSLGQYHNHRLGFRLKVEKEGIWDIRPHIKRFMYIHYSSSHPRAILLGTFKGKLTRMLKVSSDRMINNDSDRKV